MLFFKYNGINRMPSNFALITSIPNTNYVYSYIKLAIFVGPVVVRAAVEKMASSSGFVVPLSLEEIREYDRGFVCKEKGDDLEAIKIFAAHAQLLLNMIYECGGGDEKHIKKLELQQVEVLRVSVPTFDPYMPVTPKVILQIGNSNDSRRHSRGWHLLVLIELK
jgi:hypothetical protein